MSDSQNFGTKGYVIFISVVTEGTRDLGQQNTAFSLVENRLNGRLQAESRERSNMEANSMTQTQR